MNTTTAFTGSLETNPFHYQKFILRSIRVVRGSHVVVDIDTTDNVQSYITTMRASKFDRDGPGMPLEEYPEPFVQVFDLISSEEANIQSYYPDVAASLRLELYFTSPLQTATEVAVFGERLSTNLIDKLGLSWKMDDDQLARKISSIGILKHNYIGSFPADMIPEILPADSFFLCNTKSSKLPGSHCVMAAKKNGIVPFGDSLGNDPMFYRNIVLKRLEAQFSKSCRITKRTFVWPLLYLFRSFLDRKLSTIQCWW